MLRVHGEEVPEQRQVSADAAEEQRHAVAHGAEHGEVDGKEGEDLRVRAVGQAMGRAGRGWRRGGAEEPKRRYMQLVISLL